MESSIATTRAAATDELDHPRSLLHAIVNPVAGGGRAGRRWPSIATQLARHGFLAEARFTRGPGDATTLARELTATGATTILCVGGDGTANEIVNGLIGENGSASPNTRLALMPCGTGRDFARTLGVHRIDTALQALDLGVSAWIDLGRVRYVNGASSEPLTRYFLNVADSGLGAETAARINASSKALGGFVSYLSSAVRTIATFTFRDATVEVDGELMFAGKAGMVVFANGRHFAGGMVVAPHASLCDGQLDVFVLEDVGKRTLLTSLLPRVYRGTHVGRRGVLHRLGSSATVRSSDLMLVEMDGEQVGRAPVTIDVLRGALQVIGSEEALLRAGVARTRLDRS